MRARMAARASAGRPGSVGSGASTSSRSPPPPVSGQRLHQRNGSSGNLSQGDAMSLGSFDVDLEVDNAMKALEITNPEFVNFEIRFDGSTAASGSKDGSLGRESSLGRDSPSLGKDSLGPAWSTRGDTGAFSSTPPTTAKKAAANPYRSWGRKSPQMTLETTSLTHTNANNTASASGSRQGLPPQQRQQAYVAPVISVEQRSDSSSLTDANEYTSNVFREQERGGYKRTQQQQPQRSSRGGGKPEEGNGSIPEQRAVASGPQHSQQDEEETPSPSFKDRISRFGASPPAATSRTPRAAGGAGRQPQQPAAAPPWAKPKPHPRPEPQRKTTGGDGGSPFSVRLRPGSSASTPTADDDGGDSGNPFQVRLRKTGVKPALTETVRNEANDPADAGALISVTSLFIIQHARCL